jgi:hypothetical protein
VSPAAVSASLAHCRSFQYTMDNTNKGVSIGMGFFHPAVSIRRFRHPNAIVWFFLLYIER